MNRNYSKAQMNYMKAKALKEEAYIPFSDEANFDNDEIAETYAIATANYREAENELIEWACGQVEAHPKYQAHKEMIERVKSTKILRFRNRLVDLCMSLQV